MQINPTAVSPYAAGAASHAAPKSGGAPDGDGDGSAGGPAAAAKPAPSTPSGSTFATYA